MHRVTATSGKAALGALALAVLAIPAASAFASAEDPAAKPEMTAEQIEKGRSLFDDASCGACHVMADANGAGSIGPPIDGNANLDKEFVVDRITNGAGPMPSFGWLAPEDIDVLADYIMHAKK